MARGISLHVGVNFTSVSSTPLLGCVNDANEMAAIAKKHGFEGAEVIFDQQALLQTVTDKIKAIATQLVAGDIFFFTFSGHGSYIGDQSGDEPNDFRDETLVLYDFMLIDDVFAQDLWPRFAAGVRILMIADSCNSGSVAERIVHPQHELEREDATAVDRTISKLSDRGRRDAKSGAAKTISEPERIRHFARNRVFYDRIIKNLPENPEIGASVLEIGACEDNDTTADGFPNCVFTQALLDVVRRQSPPTSYTQLVADVATLLVNTQVPQLTRVGVKDPAFEAQYPFTI